MQISKIDISNSQIKTVPNFKSTETPVTTEKKSSNKAEFMLEAGLLAASAIAIVGLIRDRRKMGKKADEMIDKLTKIEAKNKDIEKLTKKIKELEDKVQKAEQKAAETVKENTKKVEVVQAKPEQKAVQTATKPAPKVENAQQPKAKPEVTKTVEETSQKVEVQPKVEQEAVKETVQKTEIAEPKKEIKADTQKPAPEAEVRVAEQQKPKVEEKPVAEKEKTEVKQEPIKLKPFEEIFNSGRKQKFNLPKAEKKEVKLLTKAEPIPNEKLPALVTKTAKPEIKPFDEILSSQKEIKFDLPKTEEKDVKLLTKAKPIPNEKLPATINKTEIKSLDEILDSQKELKFDLPKAEEKDVKLLTKAEPIPNEKLPATINKTEIKPLGEILENPKEVKFDLPKAETKKVDVPKMPEELPQENEKIEINKETFADEMRQYLKGKFGLTLDDTPKPQTGKMPSPYKRTGNIFKDLLSDIERFVENKKQAKETKNRKKEIIRERIKKGCRDKESAIRNRVLVPKQNVQQKMHETRYQDMAEWDDATWREAHITRKDFMKNRSEFIKDSLEKDTKKKVVPTEPIVEEIETPITITPVKDEKPIIEEKTPQEEMFNKEIMQFLKSNGQLNQTAEKQALPKVRPYKRTGNIFKNIYTSTKYNIARLLKKYETHVAKDEIIENRIRRGCFDKDAAIHCHLSVTPRNVQHKMHQNRYERMSEWTDEKWASATMTRKEFMQNKSEYIQEAIQKDYPRNH